LAAIMAPVARPASAWAGLEPVRAPQNTQIEKRGAVIFTILKKRLLSGM
jgi:hypothetical protein